MYHLPFYRITDYAIGILLGYALRRYKGTRLTSNQLNLGWFIATVACVGTLLLSSMMSAFNYKYDTLDAAWFASIAPIPWCLFFAWAIFTAQLGYKSMLSP